MAERPRRIWTGYGRPEDEHAVHVQEAALEVLNMLSQGWSRRSQRCDIDEYSPEVVRYHLRHWHDLESAAGGMSAAGAEPIGTSGEVDARRTLCAIKADLEQGTDWGLATILNWRWAQRIYDKQGRRERYQQRWTTFRLTWREDFTPEPWGPLAEAACIDRISRALGWYPHECSGMGD